MKRRALVGIVGAVAVALPAGAGAATFKGVVVAKQSGRHALVVASANGTVRTVRAKVLRAEVGARVLVAAARLGDGTFRASRIAVVGRVHEARIHGVVVRLMRGRTLVSAGGSVFAIRFGRGLAAVGAAASLRPGDVIEAEVSIAPSGALQESSVQQVGRANVVELEGTIRALPSGSLVLAVDDGAVVIALPPTVTLPPSIAVGHEAEELATVDGAGALTLVTVKDEEAAEQDAKGVAVEEALKQVEAVAAQQEPEEQEAQEQEALEIEAEGTVVAVDASTLAVQPGERALPVVFRVPAGFDLSGISKGAEVEAKGTVDGGTFTLRKVELKAEPADAEAVGIESESERSNGHSGSDNHGSVGQSASSSASSGSQSGSSAASSASQSGSSSASGGQSAGSAASGGGQSAGGDHGSASQPASNSAASGASQSGSGDHGSASQTGGSGSASAGSGSAAGSGGGTESSAVSGAASSSGGSGGSSSGGSGGSSGGGSAPSSGGQSSGGGASGSGSGDNHGGGGDSHGGSGSGGSGKGGGSGDD